MQTQEREKKILSGHEDREKIHKMAYFLEHYELVFGPSGTVFDINPESSGRAMLIDFVGDLSREEISNIVKKVALDGDSAKPRLQPFMKEKARYAAGKRQKEKEREEQAKREAERIARETEPAKRILPPDGCGALKICSSGCGHLAGWDFDKGEYRCTFCNTRSSA